MSKCRVDLPYLEPFGFPDLSTGDLLDPLGDFRLFFRRVDGRVFDCAGDEIAHGGGQFRDSFGVRHASQIDGYGAEITGSIRSAASDSD